MPRNDRRKNHLLTALKSSEQGQQVIYFDSESRLTIDQEHKPYLICATFARYDLEKPYTEKVYADEQHFSSLLKFWHDVDKFTGKKQSVTIYSHNAFYDMVVSHAIPELLTLGYKVISFFEKGLVFFMKLQQVVDDKVIKTLNFISTTNYFSTTLKKLAKTFGFPDKLDYDYQNGTLEDAIIYCRRDVEIIRLAMENFRSMIKDEDLGPIKPTIAGQAFASYRHKFMPTEIFIHANDNATNLERLSYFGGRVECFKIGEFTGEFFKVDVNSMYPFVMWNNLYPVKLIGYRKKFTLAKLKEFLLNGYGLISKVKLKTAQADFPYRSKKKLIFPTGEFIASLATPELAHAIKHNLIVEVYETSIYQMDKIFIDYIDYFYSKRLEARAAGNDVKVNMYKMFLTNLYGKFGQRSESWDRIGDADPNKIQVQDTVDVVTGEKQRYKIFGGSIFQHKEAAESFNSFCAVAAHVTSYARMLLASFIRTADRKNLYYCDTDSLFTNQQGYDNLLAAGHIHDSELGKLKLEEVGTTLEINAPKDYSFGGHVKLKGVKLEGLYCDIETRQIRYAGYQWPRLNSMLNDGQLGTYQNKPITKRLSRIYNGGWTTTSGTVLPYKVQDDAIINFEETYSKKLYNRL